MKITLQILRTRDPISKRNMKVEFTIYEPRTDTRTATAHIPGGFRKVK